MLVNYISNVGGGPDTGLSTAGYFQLIASDVGSQRGQVVANPSDFHDLVSEVTSYIEMQDEKSRVSSLPRLCLDSRASEALCDNEIAVIKNMLGLHRRLVLYMYRSSFDM